jgi:pentatricopeptide repeat protein
VGEAAAPGWEAAAIRRAAAKRRGAAVTSACAALDFGPSLTWTLVGGEKGPSRNGTAYAPSKTHPSLRRRHRHGTCRRPPVLLTPSRRRRHHRHGACRRSPPLSTIALAAAFSTPVRILLLGRMASSASAAALLVQPFPSSSSSSEDSDEPILLPPPRLPAPEESDPPPHQQQEKRPWWRVERDCNVLMKALARSGEVDQVVDLFAELRLSASSAGAAPGVLCYNTLLNVLAEAGRVVEIDAALDEMEAAGVPLNVSTLNIIVKLHAWQLAQFDTAYHMVLWFQRKGVEPDVGTYSTFITGLCRAGRLDEALGVLDLMLEAGCPPMVHTYTPIVQGYCSAGRIEEGKNLIAMMECAGCPANVVTYNVLIRALCEDARFDDVKEILAESGAKGWKPSTVTYNTYMNGLCKKGMAKEALQQLDVMLGEGLDLTTFTLSIVLNCLCHNSKALDAISLLQRSTEFNCCAGVVAYNTVMSRLCDLGRWQGVLQLLTDMIKKGITPNTRTLNILVHSLCKGGKSSIAKSLVWNQEFAANVVTYNTLIHWFCNYGKYSEVEDLITHMYAAKIVLDEVTFTILVDALCREGNFKGATDWFKMSLESGFSRDLLTVLINRLIHSDRIWEIHHIFRKMEEVGKCFPPDYSIFDYTIRLCCKVGFCHPKEDYRVHFILDTMLGLEKITPPTGVKKRDNLSLAS